MTTYLRTRLSVKLIGATLLFLGTVALLSTWFTVDILREVFGEQAEAQGRSIARAASIFSVEPLLIEDYPVLETYVEQMVEAKNDVAFVRVYRADGRLAAEATTSTLGTSTVAAFEADVRVSPDDPNTVGRVEIGVSTARSDALVRSHSRNMGIASATAFLVLGLLMFALLRRTVLHPLKSLDAQAVSLGAGDLETPIGLLSIDELGRLAQTLNAMRTNLKLSYEEVQAQNEELKELDRLKDEFLANVTHELKTPLNGVLGLTGAIRDGAYGDLPTPLHGPLAAVNSSAERLLDLSDQILTFSKQSDQTASVEHHEIELGAYLECVAGQFRLESEQKRLRLGVTAPADLVIHTDPNLLDQIFLNLTNNAVKFTPMGYVWLGATKLEDRGVAITVADSGIGIPTELHQKVFERFRQGFASENREYEGSGIGLSLVRQAVDRLAGEVLLESDPGKGSLFTVLLPLTDDATPAELRALLATTVLQPLPPSAGGALTGDEDDSAARSVDGDPSKPMATAGSGTTSVLVVDDDAINRQVLQAHLHREFRVLEAADGSKCLDLLAECEVDVVLLDLMMPGMSGFDVLKKFSNADKVGGAPPVIVLSARRDANAVSRAFRLGAVDYVNKPFNRDELLSRINAHVALRQREVDLQRRVAERTTQLSQTSRELKQAHQQLLQAEKMSAIGQLAAGVAHEINNPVGFVRSNMITLRDYSQDLMNLVNVYEVSEREAASLSPASAIIMQMRQEIDLSFLREDMPNLLEESLEGLDRVQKIVKDLKEFSHIDEGEWQRVDLHAGLESTLNIVYNQVKYKAEIVKDYGDLPKVECIGSQVNQVFMNLLVNAAQAIDENGTIYLRTGRDGDIVWVEVADTGRGIESDSLKRIFEPFFTTKPVGQGTGLGLSVSYRIIESHNGRIEVGSTPGQGTTFRVLLPTDQPRADFVDVELEGATVAAR